MPKNFKFQKTTLQDSFNLPLQGEPINKDPSMTEEGQSFTIQEILQRSIAGTMPNIARQTEFIDESQHSLVKELLKPDFDLTDKQIVRDRLNRAMNIIQEKGTPKGTPMATQTPPPSPPQQVPTPTAQEPPQGGKKE